MMKPRAPYRPSARQRGGVAVIAAIATIAGLSCVALAIDLGRLFFTHRDLQRRADLAALDAARIAGGCMGVRANPAEAALAEATASVLRNGGSIDEVNAGTVEVGRMLSSAGQRRFDPSTEERNRAVQVALARPAPLQLLPLFGDAAGRIVRAQAAAYSRPAATVRVGSKLLQIYPPLLNTLLGSMLGGPVSLDLLTYQNLLGATVPLAGLLDHLQVGTPGDLALAPPMPAPGFFEALAATLEDAGQSAAAQAAQALADASSDDRVVAVRDLVGIDQGIDRAQGALVSVGDLVTSAAELANGDTLIHIIIPGPPSSPSPALDLHLVQAAQQALLTPGDVDDFAHNAQGALVLSLPFRIRGLTGNLKLFAQTAEATAQVEEILCGQRAAPHDTVLVGARSSLVRLGIGEFDDVDAPDPQPHPVTLLALAPIHLGPVAVSGVTVTAYAIANPIGHPENVRMPPYVGPFPDTKALGTPPASAIAEQMADLAAHVQLDVHLPAGLPPGTSAAVLAQVQPLLDDLRPVLEDLLTTRGGDLLQQLMTALNASLAGADVTVLDVVAEEPFLFAR